MIRRLRGGLFTVGHFSPQFFKKSEDFVLHPISVPGQPAADHEAGASVTSPAVDVDRDLEGQVVVNVIQDFLDGILGDRASVGDGKANPGNHGIDLGQETVVSPKGDSAVSALSSLGKVDDVSDAGVNQGFQFQEGFPFF